MNKQACGGYYPGCASALRVKALVLGRKLVGWGVQAEVAPGGVCVAEFREEKMNVFGRAVSR